METLFIGKNSIRLNETESTNTFAIELLKKNDVPDGTIILTDNQTNGRGQRGNIWHSEPGLNLMCSLIVHPKFLSVRDHFLLSKITALAIQKTIQFFINESNQVVKIKWPNDILVNGKKICGILIENNIQQNNLKNSVIGFGINVNQINFPLDLQDSVSMAKIASTTFNKELILEKFCSLFETYYIKLKNSKFNLINEDYIKNLYGFNQLISIKELSSNQLLMGEIKEVKNNGELIFLLDDNSKRIYRFKEIQFI
jgi:BirA family biotin operon repressor/biotin-[acetyl-CoA-carboxylase] ligase